MKIEQHIDINSSNSNAIELLSHSTGLTKNLIKQAMTKGAVWLTRQKKTQRIRRVDKTLKTGDKLHIYYDESILGQQPDDAILIADEGLYSIWNKPYGMLSQGSKWGDHCTINRWVERNLKPQRPAFIVHRLDRAANGLIIIAHQKKVAAYFSKLFQNRQIEKHYHTIVNGHFQGTRTFDSTIENKPAVSHVKQLEYDSINNQSYVEVSIETGRKHQIRRHLSEAGFPIVGDRLYGNKKEYGEKDLCLTSCYLSFTPPNGGTKKSYTLK